MTPQARRRNASGGARRFEQRKRNGPQPGEAEPVWWWFLSSAAGPPVARHKSKTGKPGNRSGGQRNGPSAVGAAETVQIGELATVAHPTIPMGIAPMGIAGLWF